MDSWRSVLLPVAASVATLVVLLGFFAAGFFARGWWDQQRVVAAPSPPGPGERVVEGVTPDDDPFWGPENAAVTVVEFADFQCPFCRRHAEETLDRLRETYGDRIRYAYRDFPITELHPRAFAAAEAAQCAFAQGEYWAYHERLYANPDALSEDDLTRYAVELGMDEPAFSACLASGTYRQEVQADLDAGMEYGVTGTPAFFVNGRAIEGAAPFETFQRIIEEELAKNESG